MLPLSVIADYICLVMSPCSVSRLGRPKSYVPVLLRGIAGMWLPKRRDPPSELGGPQVRKGGDLSSLIFIIAETKECVKQNIA